MSLINKVIISAVLTLVLGGLLFLTPLKTAHRLPRPGLWL